VNPELAGLRGAPAGPGPPGVQRQAVPVSRLDYAAMTREPGPECVCGSELRKTPLPADLAGLSGQATIYVHVHSGDTRCYPGEDDKCTAEPLEAS
jgi:hypothetical protein